MTLTADGGSTKTTWKIEGNGSKRLFRTQGLNPFHQTEEEMRSIINDELLRQEGFPDTATINGIHFYGAGCTRAKSPVLEGILRELFPNAKEVEVGSDILGAAKALFGHEEGIACILGTGANSCLYDGNGIVANVSPMGYILGDEGSGAVLGRTFLNLLYKDGHPDMVETFEKEAGLSIDNIIESVYRRPTPNRFLASMAPFINRYITEPWVEEMVTNCFRAFFRRNISHYSRPDLPCSFVGSIAFYFEKQLRQAAEKEGFLIGRIVKEPLTV